MKLLKSLKSMQAKKAGGMTAEEAESYETYKTMDHNPTGNEGDVLKINDEDYYHWAFYEEDLEKKQKKTDKNFHVRFHEEIEQERYEWFCGGWIQFYDDVVRTKELGGKLHKLYFYWDRKDKEGVAIYINDEDAAKNKAKKINLIYTPPTALGDPPIPPPPPPPSSK